MQDAEPTLSSLRVLVIAPPPDFPTFPPAPNAQLSVDLPGGEHRDVTVGIDGRATIEGIDWSLGSASIVAYGLPGRSVHGVMDLTATTAAMLPKPKGLQTAADVVLYPQLLTPSASITVSGTVSSPSASMNLTLISGTRCSSVSEAGGGAYSMSCDPGKPITLIARDEQITVDGSTVKVAPNRWFRQDAPAPAGAVLEADIDFATATPLTPHKGTVHVKTSAALTKALPGTGSIVGVTSKESSFVTFLGAFSSRSATATGFDFDMEWNDIAGETPYTLSVLFGSDGSVSRTLVPGAPAADQTYDDFLAPPSMTGTLALEAPLTVHGDGGAAIIRVLVTTPTYSLVLDAPPGTKILHPPTLPADAKAKGPLMGSVFFLDKIDPDAFRFLKFARSKSVPATLP